MPLTKDSIAPLLRQLPDWPPFARTALALLPLEEAAFTQSEGFAVWAWPQAGADLRAKGTFRYVDEDGTGLIVTVAGAGGQLLELEIWRGDGRPAGKPPTVADLTVMERGVVYGP